jgi:mono/diheme cytochrome c family protein
MKLKPAVRIGAYLAGPLSALAVLAAFTPRASGQQRATADRAPTTSPQVVERGRYLVAFAACSDCHTPLRMNPTTHAPEPDLSRFLSGHPEGGSDPKGTLGDTDLALIGGSFTAFKLPFGVVYSANLTPDRETGLGTWTEAMFVRAMRTGKHMGGTVRPILPPMPWYGLAALTDADLKAIFAYVRTVPPVHNGVPAAKVPESALAEIDQQNRATAAHVKTSASKKEGKPPH